MAGIIDSLVNGVKLLKSGRFRVFWNQLHTRIYSDTVSIGLKRDLAEPFTAPSANIDLSIRPLKKEDIKPLFKKGSNGSLDPIEAYNQQNLIKHNASHCFVGVTPDGQPCYMQWLIDSKESNRKDSAFYGIFPQLKKDEALLEGAFVPPSFRGMRVMPAGMAQIACKASDYGARWVVTFVDLKNIPSLKGCHRAGFRPYIIRKDRWLLFRRKITYRGLTAETLNNYHRLTGSKPVKSPQNKKGDPLVGSPSKR